MSDDEDDYLSDKFLADAAQKPKVQTYRDLRKEAQKKSQIKQEENRTKSRRERELESRQEGLSKSLFEVEKEKEEAGVSSGNKALAMMMKMGFKPGESLGKREEDALLPGAQPSAPEPSSSSTLEPPTSKESSTYKHRTEPIAINEWSGKKGIGLGSKRALSPSATERVAKMAKMAEDSEKVDFRERARRDYEDRRAEGRLGPAQRTCASLDEKAGKEFNVLWLNTENPQTFPDGLLDALTAQTTFTMPVTSRERSSVEGRLRQQMQADALRSLDDDEGTTKKASVVKDWSSDVLEEAAQFLRLQARDRLELVLSYLRGRYHYCFWCGTQYDNEEDLASQCPGPDEESHD